ncbi:nuclear transport factor 2 family protein, partial [Cecembia rubra]|uniref:nuclear transport factor 2 family protein n=1 Tax=Cecembia rubra TaxID=1485585 RepID=UPI002F427C14
MKKPETDFRSEALKAYKQYWSSYLEGDLEAFSSTLDDGFEMIGTSESEICHSKADGIAFYKAQMAEVVGKVEMRNRRIDSVWLDPLVLVNEGCDIYVKTDVGWNFYSKLRLSTLLKETNEGWKVVQQHGSLPDMRVSDRETIAIEKISKENLELRDAIKRRTIELEQKNRELEIEAALERVRAQTMAMHSSEDVGKCVVKMFSELTAFGVDEGTRFGIGILNHDNENNQLWTARKNGEEFNLHIGNIDMASHPLLKSARKAWKAQVPFHKYVLEGEDLLNYYQMLNNAPEYKIQIPIEKLPKKEIQHCFIFEHGFFYAFSPIEFQPELIHITKRFSVLFEQTYRRYLDLVKAESQAREAQIQLALERVRARTMAMQKSEELSEVSYLLNKQVVELGIPTRGCAFNIYNEHDSTEWFSDLEGTLPSYQTPREYIFKEYYEAGQRGESLLVDEFSGDRIKELYQYFASQNHTGNEAIDKHLAKAPEYQINHMAYFKYGYLLFVTLVPAPEAHDVFKRFAKEFEQTYTRFLDLQKAETQAREAQIENALEKVRSRTMAMQHSNELTDVAGLLFNQVSALGIKTWTAGFNVWSEDNNSYVDYLSLNGEIYGPNTVHTEKAEALKELSNARKSGVEFDVLYVEGEKIKQLYLAVSGIDEKEYDTMVKDGLLPSQQYEHFVFGAKVSVMFITYEPVPEAHDIFKRLGKVFEQTYTRFLDLQKAEAQARETQIQLSLERIRAKAMAMQHSDELSDFLTVVFEQFEVLNLNPVNCILSLFDIENNRSTFRMTGKNGATLIAKQEIDLDASPVWKQKVEGWKLGHPNDVDVLNIPFENLPEIAVIFKEILEKLPEGERPLPEDYPNGEYIIDGYCKYGYLGYTSSRAPSDEEKEITRRIATEFGNVYQRFLDLQKAEAQARESQIEAALERVRSKSLAMHHSDELEQVVACVFEMIVGLGIVMDGALLYVFNRESKNINLWLASVLYPNPIFIDLPFEEQMLDNEIIRDLWESTDNRQSLNRVYSGEGKNDYFRYVQRYNRSKFPEPFDLPDWTFSFAAEKNSVLGIDSWSGHTFTESDLTLLRRFAKVFEQAYIRFLDLQKAEAQARESQIQLSLERIRAKAMAMQHSDELGDFLTVVFEQFDVLNLNPVNCHLAFLDLENNRSIFRLTGKNGATLIATQEIDLDASPVWKQKVEAWKSGRFTDVDVLFVPVEKLPEIGEIFKEILDKIPENDRPLPEDYPNGEYITEGNCKYGYLGYSASRPPSEEEKEITRRIASEFGNVYQRFLDLQKAEAQARESQIQLSLERIRAKAMAMQHSDELSDFLTVVFEQFTLLDLKPVFCHLSLLDLENNRMTYRMTGSKGARLFSSGQIDLDISSVWYDKIQELKLGRPREVDVMYFPSEIIPEISSHVKEMLGNPPENELPQPEDFPVGQYVVEGYCKYGYLGYSASSPPSDEAREITRRISNEFGNVYQRFLDLQKAEAQALEATKRASVDRVRAEIASMRTTSDLERIQPLIWNELKILGVPFIRCGVFIMDQAKQEVQAFLSTPDGKSIAAFHLPYQATEQTSQIVSHWQQKQSYKDHMDEAAFAEFTRNLVEQGAMASTEKYVTENRPTDLYLHFLPFLQGMLYVGNDAPLIDGELQLVQNLAEAFSTAYARYEDFNKLELAKAKVESAMSELKATQAQLVQQEKLASLGQPTAGIAHEIKNPLNFVNNFSEVSLELLDEVKETRIKR